MAFPLAWVVLAAVVVVVPFCCWMLIRRYTDPSDSSWLLTLSATLALALSLLCVALVPIDIYIVSSSLDSTTGEQRSPEDTAHAGTILKTLYYVFYCAMLAFAFFILPFVYFWFEEEDDTSSPAQRACTAFKYSIAFLLVFVILITLGVVFRGGKFSSNGSDDEKWIDRLHDSFNVGDSIIGFCVSCLALLGIFGWAAYAAFGLAHIPISIIRSKPQPQLGGQETDDENVPLQLRKTQAEIQFISTRYELGDREWSKNDKTQMAKLKREERRLQAVLRVKDQKAQRNAPQCWRTCWNAMAPLRFPIGLALLGVSILIVVSFMLSAIDRAVHSDCGTSCAYAIDKPRIPNPIDEVLRRVSVAFPVDFIFYGGIVLYIFLASISGMVVLGVRLLVWKLYEVRPKRTMPHGMVMGVWLIMFTVLLLNMELIALAPQYTTFGEQFYQVQNADNTTSTTACSVAAFGYNSTDACVMTQVARFIHSTDLAVPFFGVLFYYTNWLFIGAFVISLLYVIGRKPSDENYEELQEDVW